VLDRALLGGPSTSPLDDLLSNRLRATRLKECQVAKDEPPPKGSGYYAAIVGTLFLLILIGTFWLDVNHLSREWLIRVWLGFVSASLLYWGINRIRTGRSDPTVGQDTINLVNGVISSTIALLALILPK
jgi:hypothetical protein